MIVMQYGHVGIFCSYQRSLDARAIHFSFSREPEPRALNRHMFGA